MPMPYPSNINSMQSERSNTVDALLEARLEEPIDVDNFAEEQRKDSDI